MRPDQERVLDRADTALTMCPFPDGSRQRERYVDWLNQVVDSPRFELYVEDDVNALVAQATEVALREYFTPTETLRRLRQLVHEVKEGEGLPKTAPWEVGTRTHPVRLLEPPTRESEWYRDHDDLDQTCLPDDAKHRPQVQVHGAVVHLYVQQPIGFGEWELGTVCCGWMGTPEHSPVLLDRDGRREPELWRG